MNKRQNLQRHNQNIVWVLLMTFFAVMIIYFGFIEKKHSKEYPIFLYYTDKNYSFLIPELQHVSLHYPPPSIQTNEQLKTILYRLFYPSNNELKSPLPKNLKIVDVTLEKNTAIVKMGLLDKCLGTGEETLMIGAIVDTLTELPDIKKVKIVFIKGEGLHLDYTKPFTRDYWLNLINN